MSLGRHRQLHQPLFFVRTEGGRNCDFIAPTPGEREHGAGQSPEALWMVGAELFGDLT
jgi:hypothetical protein